MSRLVSPEWFAVSRLSLLFAAIVLLALSRSADAQFPWFGEKTEEPAIEWIDEPEVALTAARKSGKPVLAYVTSTHCGYCRKMERETWSEPAVVQLIQRSFVPLRLQADKYPDEVAALRVRAYPTTVLITADGKAFAGKQGFLEPTEVAELLRPVLEPRAVAARPAAVN